MPLYEYECTQCGQVEEVLQKFSDKPLKKCRTCSGSLRKLISNSSFHLKGTGWYVTDYAKKPKTNTATNSKDTQSKTSDSKPAPENSTSGSSAD